jgi:hypothetical protein
MNISWMKRHREYIEYISSKDLVSKRVALLVSQQACYWRGAFAAVLTSAYDTSAYDVLRCGA